MFVDERGVHSTVKDYDGELGKGVEQLTSTETARDQGKRLQE
jgi:hypothetical protein